MWYEIFPAFFLYAGCLSVPFIIVPSVNYMFLGKPMLREATSNPDRETLRRDNCLDPTGKMNCNHTIYWEGIPDAKD